MSDSADEQSSEDENVESAASDDNDSDNDQEPGSNDESGDDSDADMDGGENIGWAAAFARTLEQEKPKNKKYLVLSRAKKLSDRAKQADAKSTASFEIEDNGEIKPDIDLLDVKPTTDTLELAAIEQKERNDKLAELRVKPSGMDLDRERSFKRIATKGVVQLFNAVRSQQKDLVDKLEQAGPLDHKRDAVLNNINKRQFLDMLMGGKRAKSENVDNPVKSEADEDESSRPSQWSVLRDDFMTNKKTSSHWDKDEDEDSDA